MERVVPWLLLVIGLAIAGVAGVTGVRSVVTAVQQSETWTTPAVGSVNLDSGDWVVYELAMRVVYHGPPGSRRPVPVGHTVSWEDVHVTGPGGSVAVTCAYCGSSDTLTVGSDTYSGIARFTAPESGAYRIAVRSEGVKLLVAPSVGQSVLGVISYVALVALGLLLAFAAVIWLVVVFIRSRSTRPTTPVPLHQLPPPRHVPPPPVRPPPPR